MPVVRVVYRARGFKGTERTGMACLDPGRMFPELRWTNRCAPSCKRQLRLLHAPHSPVPCSIFPSLQPSSMPFYRFTVCPLHPGHTAVSMPQLSHHHVNALRVLYRFTSWYPNSAPVENSQAQTSRKKVCALESKQEAHKLKLEAMDETA